MGGGDGQAVQESRIGQPTQLVQCRDWNEADVRERYGTLEALRRFAGGPTGSPAGRGRTLDDDAAFELFDRWCEKPFARGFRLYKLYTRAAAFSSVSE
jgi:hypothetical protein